MRKKSLLVSANAPFIGPRIYLEEGSWKVDEIDKDVEINIQLIGDEVFILDESVMFMGPACIQAELVNGNGVSLAVRQVASS